MNDTKYLNRRRLLQSSLGAVGAVVLGGCASEGNSSEGNDEPMGGGTNTSPSETSSSPSTNGTPGNSPTTPATNGPTPANGGMGGAPSPGGGGTPGSAGTGGTPGSAGMGGTPNGSAGMGGAPGNAGTGGTPGGAGMGGASGGAADMDAGASGGVMCTTVVEMVNNHIHEVTVPWSDVERGYQDAPYMLEDGGTGHTHTLALSGYDFLYLQAGATQVVASSLDAEHSHLCEVTCAPG